MKQLKFLLSSAQRKISPNEKGKVIRKAMSNARIQKLVLLKRKL